MLPEVRHSVRKKLMLVVLATTFTALLLTGIAMVAYDLRTYEQTWVNDLATQADILGRASAPALLFDDPKAARENLALLRARPKISAAAIYTARGSLFATYQRDDADPDFPRLPEANSYRIQDRQLVLFRRIETPNEILGTVYLKASYELFERLRSYLDILGAVMIVSLLVAVLMSAWLQAAVTKPILAITEVARQVMTRRDFSLRAQKTTDDELGYLTETFNSMLAEVDRRATALEQANLTLEREMGERRHAETALLAADRRKDEFLATLAHELRNPLAPLRNALEILRIAGANESAAQAARDMMDRQLRQMVRLVDDLLDVSRITTGKLRVKDEQVELHAVIRNALDTASPLIESRKHHLTVALPERPVYMRGDATRLAQVFLNLLNNAAKFTEPGGRISCTAQLEDSQVVVTIADSGIGIAPEMLPTVFEMFAQVDRSLERTFAGLGVGLTLAKRLLELHGGSLEAHSAGLGRGSQFVVRLPVTAALAADSAPLPDSTSGTRLDARRRILLAEDNEDFSTSFAMILRAMGHEVHVAHDGLSALEAASVFKPDFAFLDIGLPKLNGYELARRIRALPGAQHVTLVAVTGWGQENDKRRAREAGFDHHMVKPVEPDQVEQILTRAYSSS